jgi:magnesium transporter
MVVDTSSKKMGLAPGTLTYTGTTPKDRSKLSVIVYNDQVLEQQVFFDWSALEKYIEQFDEKYVKWINVDGINHIHLIEKIGEYYNIHPLSLEDIVHIDQRPKFEEFDHYLIAIFRAFYYQEKQDESKDAIYLISEQLSLVLAKNNTLISFQENIAIDPFEVVRKRMNNPKSKVRRSKSDYLLYALIDATVDYYFVCIEKLGDKVEDIEREIIKDKNISISSSNIFKIYRLKKDIIHMRKIVWPMRDMVNNILHYEDNDMISENTKFYLRDVYDHIVRIIDSIETQRDLVSGLIDFYLSMNANKMNEVMKFLTIISTIFIPVTFIAGIYGMNFDNMPELRHPYGYFITLLIMFLIIISLLYYFKMKKWL